jgi:hypothetical protein
MIRETVLPFKLGITNDTLTPNSGLVLFGELLRAIRLDEMARDTFPKPGSGRGYDAWTFLFPLLLMLQAGGRSLEDLRKIVDDQGLLRLLQVQDTPSTDAVGDWLRRIGRRGVRALRSINRKLLKKALKRDGRTGYTLDIDATVIEAWKELALFTYKHFKGYVPILGHLAENGLVVAWEFREGNVPPAKENLEFYRRCKTSMPPGKRITAFRADAASYQGDLFDELTEDEVVYAVGGRLDKATLELINAIRPDQWRPYQDGWIAETVHTMNEMKTAFRLVVIKRPAQPSLFGEESPSDRYHVIASTREETAEETVAWYNRRGDCSENRIKELKNGFGMERMPCGQFEANALFFAIGVLAYNLYKMFTEEILPFGFGRRQVQSVRYAFYSLAGKVVSTGGQLWLKVSPAHFDFFSRVRRAIVRIQSG